MFRRHSFVRRRSVSKYRKLLWLIPILLVLIVLQPLWSIITGPWGFMSWQAWHLTSGHAVVLLQNEYEQRPGGGFISAVAIIELNRGKPDIQILDSYAIADPPANHPVPPLLEEALGQDPKWNGITLRDANITGDFPTSVDQVINLLRKDPRYSDLDIKLVAAINQRAIGTLLDHFGNSNIPSDQLFLELQRASKDIDLHNHEALAARKNIAGDLAASIMQNIGYWQLDELATIGWQLAKSKDIQITFTKQSLEQTWQDKGFNKGFSGNVWQNSVSNLGAKKSDRYLQRTDTSLLQVANDGQLTEQVTMAWQHFGTANLQSDTGQYWIQLIRPRGTTTADQSWQTTQAHTYARLEKLITLNPGEPFTLEVTLDLPLTLQFGEQQTWQFISQSGSDAEHKVVFQGPGDTSWRSYVWERDITPGELPACEVRENIMLCQWSQDHELMFDWQPDVLSPILENHVWQNDRELFIRFSEPIRSATSILLTCPRQGTFRVTKDNMSGRDITVAFDQAVVLNQEFCTLTGLVNDAFGNQKQLQNTVPLRTS